MDLLYIRHPNPQIHQNQVETLANMNEPEKSYFGQILRIGNASMHYYQSGKEPSEEDYQDWLSGLSDPIKTDMINKGFSECKSILGLRRHALERSDIGMDEYLKNILNADDYTEWKNKSMKR